MRRSLASVHSNVDGESLLLAADKAGAPKLPTPGASWEEHRRRGPMMINSTPNARVAPAPAGVATLNWFDAAFRIDRIGCP